MILHNSNSLAVGALTLALLAPGSRATAASRVIDVTPDNIGSQPIELRVESKADDEENTIRFDVFVSSRSSGLSSQRQGRLEVAHEVPGPQAGETPSRPILSRSVRESSQDGFLRYRFELPQYWLPLATFTFQDQQPNSASMDAFVFHLADFASPELVAYEVEPELVSMQEPRYPETAKQQGVEGLVLVRVLIGEDGRVQDSIVIQSVPVLDESAVAAAKTAVFKPAMRKDRPVPVWLVIPVEFRLPH